MKFTWVHFGDICRKSGTPIWLFSWWRNLLCSRLTSSQFAFQLTLTLNALQMELSWVESQVWTINKLLEFPLQAGWGKSESDAPHENIPRQVHIRAVNDSVCYTTDYHFALMSSLRTFCAGGKGAGPCQGDSGQNISNYQSIWRLLRSFWQVEGSTSKSERIGRCEELCQHLY